MTSLPSPMLPSPPSIPLPRAATGSRARSGSPARSSPAAFTACGPWTPGTCPRAAACCCCPTTSPGSTPSSCNSPAAGPIRFLVYDAIYRQPLLNPILRLFGAIPISPGRAKDGMRAGRERLRAGEVVCLFPEGRADAAPARCCGSRKASSSSRGKAARRWCRCGWTSSGAPSSPSRAAGISASCPQRFPYPVTVAFGEPLTPEKADVATVRERLLELGEIATSTARCSSATSAKPCVRGLKKQLVRAGRDRRHGPFARSRAACCWPPPSCSRGICSATCPATRRHRAAAEQGRGAGQPRRPARGQSAREPELHRRAAPRSKPPCAGPRSTRSSRRRSSSARWSISRGRRTSLRLDEILPPLKKKIGLWRAARRRAALARPDPPAAASRNAAGTTRRCCSSPAAVRASRRAWCSATATSSPTSRSSA